MHNTLRFGMGLAAIGLLMSSIAPVFASVNDKDELSAPDVRGIQRRVAPNEVTLNGKTLFLVPCGAGGLSAAERAEVIRERLDDITTHFVIGAGSVAVSEVEPDTFAIRVDGQLLATVEPAMARAVGDADAVILADRWAERVRETLPMARQVAVRRR